MACQKEITLPFHSDSKAIFQWDSKLQAQIINGEEVAPNDPLAASTVALYMPQKAPSQGITNFCTGTLIAKNVVLSAGHCFLDVSEGYLRIPLEEFLPQIRIGFGLPVVLSETDTQITFRKIQRVVIHPDYRAGMVRRAMKIPMPDVAIIFLDEDAPEGFTPATLGLSPDLIQKGREITLAGYGVTEASLKAKPKQLMKVQVRIDNPQMTSAQFTYKVENHKSACFADSGGPAYFQLEDGQYVVGGITSWGDGYCAKMGAYTSVPAFASFVTETLNQAAQ
jgi:hypothetical protein